MRDSEQWLVVIDPQVIFADPASQWGSPMWAEALPHILRLTAHFGPERTILTRWVPWPPGERPGSWDDYMKLWPFADRTPDDPQFNLVAELAGQGIEVDAPTFGKWEAIRRVTGDSPRLVMAGVSTDCCVISSALPAADAGAEVRLVGEACAGSDVTFHDMALRIMGLYEPQIALRTTGDIVGAPTECR